MTICVIRSADNAKKIHEEERKRKMTMKMERKAKVDNEAKFLSYHESQLNNFNGKKPMEDVDCVQSTIEKR